MPKKLYPEEPPKAPRLLKFRFSVPFIVPVTMGASKLPMAREKCRSMVNHGDFVLNLDVTAARPARSDAENWPAEIAWICPSCNHENWFLLGHDRTCEDRCPKCHKNFIIIEGFIHRLEKGCDTCQKRIECLVIQRAEVVKLEPEDCL